MSIIMTVPVLQAVCVLLMSIIAYLLYRPSVCQPSIAIDDSMPVIIDATSNSSSSAQSNSSRLTLSKSSSRRRFGPLKMVLLVRCDLGMTKGKIAAQCCHGAVGLVQELMTQTSDDIARVEQWDDSGAMKIALRVNDEQELMQMEKQARQNKLPNYLVVDAGQCCHQSIQRSQVKSNQVQCGAAQCSAIQSSIISICIT